MRRRALPVASAVAALVMGLALAAAARAGEAPPDSLDAARLARRVDDAVARGDMRQALVWAQRLRAVAPDDAEALYKLSVTLHDFAVAAPMGEGSERPMLRTSLERIAFEREALGLADTAAAMAPDPPRWARAVYWRGQMLEYLGLPVDAMEAYARIERRVRGVPAATVRIYWLKAHLRDPLLPDRIAIPRWILRETIPAQ